MAPGITGQARELAGDYRQQYIFLPVAHPIVLRAKGVAFSPGLHSPSQKGAVPSIRQIGVGLFVATVGQQRSRFVSFERLAFVPAGQPPCLTSHFAAGLFPRPFQ
jgi:hypothetical protein